MNVRTVWISEQPDGLWLVTSPRRRSSYRTAARALRSVKRADAREVEATGETVATVIEWEPITRVGLAVVRAIVDTNGRTS